MDPVACLRAPDEAVGSGLEDDEIEKMIVPGHRNVSAVLSELTQGNVSTAPSDKMKSTSDFQARKFPAEGIHPQSEPPHLHVKSRPPHWVRLKPGERFAGVVPRGVHSAAQR